MISIFYHAFLPGKMPEHENNIHNEQLRLLDSSGLLEIANLYTNTYTDSATEYPTMKMLEEYCHNHDGNVLYFHTKGVTRYDCMEIEHVTRWRHMMEYFNITKWKDAQEILKTYDTYGCQWLLCDNQHSPHYSGNFWWSTCAYIRTLPSIPETWKLFENRLELERWIGRGNGKHYVAYQDGNTCTTYEKQLKEWL